MAERRHQQTSTPNPEADELAAQILADHQPRQDEPLLCTCGRKHPCSPRIVAQDHLMTRGTWALGGGIVVFL